MRLVISLLLFTHTAGAYAQLQFPDNWGAGLYLDQDLAIPFLNEDRDYTMGIAAEFFWQDKTTGLYPLDGTVKRLGQWLGLHEKNDKIIRSFMLGSVTYTPDNLASPDPVYNDRPYASLIYLSNKRVRANPKNAVGVELQVGLLGTRISANIQTTFHQTWRKLNDSDTPVDPMGWDHQISDGGELTFRLKASNSQFITGQPNRWDLATSGAATLGYQTNFSAGLSARIGKIASPSWTIPYDPINRGNFLPSFAKNEFYGWASYRLRIVAYDALLQGQFKHSDVTFTSTEIEHILHEGGFGFTFTQSAFQISLSANYKSPEIKSGIDRRNQYWGGLYFVYHY